MCSERGKHAALVRLSPDGDTVQNAEQNIASWNDKFSEMGKNKM